MKADQQENWHVFESIGLRVVSLLAKRALAFYNHLPPTEFKPDRSLVSAADRSIEQEARLLLKRETPDCGFYGEEFGSSESSLSEIFWMLDPIDGTTNFLSKVPTWSILLALVARGQPRVGIVAFPALGEVFSASSGFGASFGPLDESVAAGKKPLTRCYGTKVEALSDAHVAYSSPAQFAFRGTQNFFQRLAFGAREFRTQSDAFGYSRVLCGGIDAMIDMVAAPYDLAALEVLFEETPGLQFSSFWGKKGTGSFGRGGAIAASSQGLHMSLLHSLDSSLQPEAGQLQHCEIALDSVELSQAFHRCFLRSFLNRASAAALEHVTLIAAEKHNIQAKLGRQNFSSNAFSDELKFSQVSQRDTKLYGHMGSSTWARSISGTLCEASLQRSLQELSDEHVQQGQSLHPWKPLNYIREVQLTMQQWLEFMAYLKDERFASAARQLVAENAADVQSLTVFAELACERTISGNGSDALKQSLSVQGYFEEQVKGNEAQGRQLFFRLNSMKYESAAALELCLLAELRELLATA